MKRIEPYPSTRSDIESVWVSVFPSNVFDSLRHLILVVVFIFRLINIVIERRFTPDLTQIDDVMFKSEKVQKRHVTDTARPILGAMILPFSFQRGLPDRISV